MWRVGPWTSERLTWRQDKSPTGRAIGAQAVSRGRRMRPRSQGGFFIASTFGILTNGEATGERKNLGGGEGDYAASSLRHRRRRRLHPFRSCRASGRVGRAGIAPFLVVVIAPQAFPNLSTSLSFASSCVRKKKMRSPRDGRRRVGSSD